jgi:deazaflavin-dependent oxidoreductase (nitroreductase family)
MSNMPLWERYIGVPLLGIHDTIYKKTNGRIGHRIPGTPPSLLLHTVGAKTGIKRTNTLSYAEGGAYLVVASKAGDPKAPGWYHNLKANPRVETNIGPKAAPRQREDHRSRRPGLSEVVEVGQRQQLQPL